MHSTSVFKHSALLLVFFFFLGGGWEEEGMTRFVLVPARVFPVRSQFATSPWIRNYRDLLRRRWNACLICIIIIVCHALWSFVHNCWLEVRAHTHHAIYRTVCSPYFPFPRKMCAFLRTDIVFEYQFRVSCINMVLSLNRTSHWKKKKKSVKQFRKQTNKQTKSHLVLCNTV